MTRREAIQRVTVMLGGITLVGGSGLITACTDERTVRSYTAVGDLFTADDVAFLDEVADTMLPETDTPGAKAAAVGPFMALMVHDVYSLDDQQIFRNGMRQLDAECERMHGVAFMAASPEQRLELLEQLDQEQKTHTDARQEARRRSRDAVVADQPEDVRAGDPALNPEITADAPAHYFRMMKELALLGYFTSEIGYTQAMRYVESPGRFDPCVPYSPGEKIWAPHA
ncbi:MAG: gluconate 2-dehydrogenase subunit 3 family protein [Gemmatimonadetes bacterium]|nr:gluconate 2-dehydrogenase subunit 3 family protein [Gemmatimonadota bacterium]